MQPPEAGGRSQGTPTGEPSKSPDPNRSRPTLTTGRVPLGSRGWRAAGDDYWRRRRLAALVGVEAPNGGVVHLAVFCRTAVWVLCGRSVSAVVPSTSARRLCRDCE